MICNKNIPSDAKWNGASFKLGQSTTETSTFSKLLVKSFDRTVIGIIY